MKINILILLFCIASIQAISQNNKKNDFEKERLIRGGVKVGVNLNKIQGQSFRDEYSFNYNIGGFMQINFSRKFGIQPEVNLVQASAKHSDDYTEIYDDITFGGSQIKSKLNYLKVVPLLNLNIGPTPRVKLQFGPQWGFLLKERVDSTTQNIYKKGDFSLVGGIMLQLPVVHFGGRYEHGLSNINDVDDRDVWKSQSFQIFAGITF